MHAVFEIFLITFVSASAISNFFGAPGNILIVFGSFFYALTTGFHRFSFPFVLTLLAVMLLFELLEFILISISAKRYGTSKWGIAGAIIGGILGAFSGAFFTPLFGAILGSLLGVFLGAFVVEILRNPNIAHGLKAGYGAFLGRLGGLSIKMVGSVTLAVMIVNHLI